MFKKIAREEGAENYRVNNGIVYEKEPDKDDDKITENSLLEKLADVEHKQWAHWTKYMLDNMTEENVERWKKQIETEYKDLTEKEKDSDREWAQKAIDIMSEFSEKIDTDSIMKSIKEIKTQLEDMDRGRKQDNEDIINILQSHGRL